VAIARSTRLGVVFAFFAYASWGLLSPVGKHLIEAEGFPLLWLNAIRFLIATPILLLFIGRGALRASIRLLRPGPILWANLLASASLTLFLYSLPLLANPTYATLGFYTAPLWTALLAHFALRERVGFWFAPAAIGLLGGGYVALFGLHGPPAGFGLVGMTLAVLSGVVWAVYSVQLRGAAGAVELQPMLGAAFITGTVWFLLAALVFEGSPRIAATTAGWAWMGLYVAVPTLASFVLFNAALRLAPASTANLLVGAELAFTALFSALLFGGRFGNDQLVGLAVVLLAVSGYLWLQARRPAATPSS
jgi:drug/metabolite transporter (DMT)-like permease